MKINFLKPLKSFQYSINLEYDINDDSKVSSFIPTNSSLEIMNEVIYSVLSKDENVNRAKLLTAAYGKGKSHLTLALTAFLSGKDKKLFKNILSKAKTENSPLYENMNLYISGKKKLFPVVVKTTSSELKTNLLNSLSNALTRQGLSKLMPSTFFDVAIETIQNWEENYPETFKKFEKHTRTTGVKYIDALRNYDQEKYDLFVNTYPLLTSGSVFNPMIGTDVIKLLENVIIELKKHGYSGLFFVYDEFGKFLEGSIDTKTTANDLKLLQDLAERCDRSSVDEQLHLFLISHKGIDNYVGQLSKEKVDNWKGIAGRFNKLTIMSNDAEIYGMIAGVLKKTEREYADFINTHQDEFVKLHKLLRMEKTLGARSGAFADVIETNGEGFIETCYPLHPYSLLMLPKVSELVAQNERSVFTYLASSEKNTVGYYARRNDDEFPLIEPDLIYDYFEQQFKGEPFGSDIRSQWQIASAAIAKLLPEENELAIKIVKTLSLIYIINQFEILPPSADLIYEIYRRYSPGKINAAFSILRKEELIIELEFKPYIRLRNSSNNNLQEILNKEISSIGNVFDFKQVLLGNMQSKYFYPVQYNDRLEITRYFEFVFITYSELMNVYEIDHFISEYEADGLILGILVSDEQEKEDAVEKAMELGGNRCVYVMPKTPKLIEESLRKYKAITNLVMSKSSDIVLVEELNYIKQDLSELIKDYVDSMYIRPEKGEIEYIYNGNLIEIRRRTALSNLLSEICEQTYALTPRIINENINRNKISGTMSTTRKKVLEKVLENYPRPKFDLVSSQDINVVRSVYLVPGIIRDLDNITFDIEHCNVNMRNVLHVIDEFVAQATITKVSFQLLYDVLVRPENGIGLKKGIIPFYIAVVLRLYKQHMVVYYKNRELAISAELLLSINEHPELYQIKVEMFNVDDENYLNNLAVIFGRYTKANDLEVSRFDYIVKAMQRWYLSLTKFDKSTKICCNDELEHCKQSIFVTKFKNVLGEADVNARDFLFEKLPKFAKNQDKLAIIDLINSEKIMIDNNLKNLVAWISLKFKVMLGAKENVTLYSAMCDYYENLNKRTQSHVFNNSAMPVLDSLRNPGHDEDKTIRKLVKNVLTLRIEDFDDKLFNSLLGELEGAVETINEYNRGSENQSGGNSYSLIINNNDGTKRELNFDDYDNDGYGGNFFYNEVKSLIDDYASTISDADKGKVLLKILRELYE